MAASLPGTMAALVAVGVLAALVLAAVRYAPSEGASPLRPFLIIAACILTGALAGAAVYLLMPGGMGGLPPHLLGFLASVLAALVVAALYGVRR